MLGLQSRLGIGWGLAARQEYAVPRAWLCWVGVPFECMGAVVQCSAVQCVCRRPGWGSGLGGINGLGWQVRRCAAVWEKSPRGAGGVFYI